MNDDKKNRAKLLAETFHDNWEAGQPAAFAREAAAVARRRHFARRSLRAAGTAAFVAIAAFVLLRRPVTQPPALAEPAKHFAPSRGYEILSDEELLAQVRDQALLAVRNPNGTRQIVVIPSER
jgi:hypothetical protein